MPGTRNLASYPGASEVTDLRGAPITTVLLGQHNSDYTHRKKCSPHPSQRSVSLQQAEIVAGNHN